jgi:hypothetical protein
MTKTVHAVPINPELLSPLLTSYISMLYLYLFYYCCAGSTLWHLQNSIIYLLHLITNINTFLKSTLYSNFYSFPLISFSCPASLSRTFSHYVSSSSQLWQFLRLCLFLMTLTVVKSTSRYFGSCPSIGSCLMVFLLLE